MSAFDPKRTWDCHNPVQGEAMGLAASLERLVCPSCEIHRSVPNNGGMIVYIVAWPFYENFTAYATLILRDQETRK
jgi:hypothetical protein